MKKSKIFILSFIILLFLGAKCSERKPKDQHQPSESTEEGIEGASEDAMAEGEDVADDIEETDGGIKNTPAPPIGEPEKAKAQNKVYEDTGGIIQIRKYEDSLEYASIPKFPWPPPKPSAKMTFASSVFQQCAFIGQVDSALSYALRKNGYEDISYFRVPSRSGSGFALATQLEQIDKYASPKKPPNRWVADSRENKNTFPEVLLAALFPNPGYFRVIVFVVTDQGFKPSPQVVDKSTAMSWVDSGYGFLPVSMAKRPFTKNHTVTALIYEYELLENNEFAKLKKPSKHSPMVHLRKSKLWDALNKT